ncbi:bifunctional metallophosphatase/5'-nucleotidase [Bradyrhizobium sp. LHD-71]|uniref:bifunctional metallophosphatase/5'-nucleotidase n=1 Tax=Bradyrhizobium sp. LHD-71 TaxID=3072141 RepID=UPI00280C512C|nr:bifunctional metallophosphatase/5'-nucleotidase [Bradyrhizobium sp. LHD-71]MDQ8731985.1 bifunctional metallophosphatase/5'-nucleotidase [Bradyrhizobium sp. LHD-71]
MRLRYWIAPLAALVLIVTGFFVTRSGIVFRRAPVELTILALNDFHGNLQPPPGGIRVADPADKAKKIAVPAGGAEHLATLVKERRKEKTHSIFVAAGDLIGASPFLSALFHDEPTIEALSIMGLDVASVGNHEFDEGATELKRMQDGGCHPTEGCKGPHPFLGAKFRYLAASTVEKATGKTFFPAYEVREFGGIPVAFIGLTLKATPLIVNPAGVAGLEFRDEVETVNALVPEIRARGIEAIVVLIHEGGFPTGGYNECPGISGPIVGIVSKFDKAVDIVVSGHTHQAYVCNIGGRLVTSADKYGTILTEIDVKLDPATRDIISAKAGNTIVRTDAFARDVEQTRLIAAYDERAKPIAARPSGKITDPILRDPNRAGESVLGDIVADAQLAATAGEANGGAVIAFTNPGGIRNSIPKSGDGTVTYADVFASQPFRNQLVTMTLTGAQIKQALEQQWTAPSFPRILQVSRGFGFSFDTTRPIGDRVPIEGITFNGTPIDSKATYRVTVNDFLASGGDGFSTFKDGVERRTGVYDVDALDAYFKAHSPISPHVLDRIRRVD